MSPRSSGCRTCRLIPVIARSAATTQSRSGEREIGTQLSPEGAVAAVAQRSRSTVAASTDARFLVSCMALGYVGKGARRPVPAVQAEWPLSVQLADPARTHWNGRDAPIPDVRPIPEERGLVLYSHLL